MTTVRLPDTLNYATVDLASRLVTPSARAYGSEHGNRSPRCRSPCITRRRQPTAVRWWSSGAPATNSRTRRTRFSRYVEVVGWSYRASRTPGRGRPQRSSATSSWWSAGRTRRSSSRRPRVRREVVDGRSRSAHPARTPGGCVGWRLPLHGRRTVPVRRQELRGV
jgi:hypothetical protein